MPETKENDFTWSDLRAMWDECAKRERDYRDKGEVALLEQMQDGWNGLKACGWREIEYCPKDGSRFLAISAGSTGVCPHYYKGEWPQGSWWAESCGDLWPSRPILWKPMPPNTPAKPPAEGGSDSAQS